MLLDQCTIEELAGDLLEEPSPEQLVATGYNRNTPMNGSGGSKTDGVRNAMLVDRVNTTTTVWKGTTLGCTPSHTHKYDPFTIEEYFRVYAYFDRRVDLTVLRNEAIRATTMSAGSSSCPSLRGGGREIPP